MVKCGSTVITARGSSIDSFNLRDGSLLSTWTCPTPNGTGKSQTIAQEVSTKVASQTSDPSSVEITLDASVPVKKRKLSASEPGGAKPVSKEGKKKQNNRSGAVASGLEAPAVISLAVTKVGCHVIAVTGEDKSIRVFENVEKDGVHQLDQLSQR